MRTQSLLLAIGMALFATPLFAQVPLEHFQCYVVLEANPNPDAVVGLLDQFQDPETVEVVRARRFCNPVGKFHRNQFNPVQDIRQHLTLYATFPQSAPLRIVRLSNQFNPAGQPQQVWRVREAVALAVPTHKPPHEVPVGLDHFRCYAANGNPVFEPVGLVDQFVPFVGHFVLDPVLFCNPVRKTHNGVVTPVQNPDAHLACYSMTRVPFETTREIRNQFGPQTFALGPADTLCVPTRKIGFQTIPDGPIGGSSLEIEAIKQ
jgi:hypothetical protein